MEPLCDGQNLQTGKPVIREIPFLMAYHNDRLDVDRLLLDNETDMYKTRDIGLTSLKIEVSFDHYRITEVLIKGYSSLE